MVLSTKHDSCNINKENISRDNKKKNKRKFNNILCVCVDEPRQLDKQVMFTYVKGLYSYKLNFSNYLMGSKTKWIKMAESLEFGNKLVSSNLILPKQLLLKHGVTCE